MKISDTISVNPGKNTLGHVESSTSSLFRNPVIDSTPSSHSMNVMSIVFPSTKSGLGEFRKYDVPLRTIFATILIVSGLSMLLSTGVVTSTALGVCSLCFGLFLALGLMTRPVMIGAAVYYCICGALSIRAGVAEISYFSLMFGCLIFGVIGAGKYSCDTLLRNVINRTKRNAVAKRREKMMGYKAFHAVRF